MNNSAPRVSVSADLADLVPRYLDNRYHDLTYARGLLAELEFYAIAGIAHRIQGSAASYGFAGLGEIAQGLQDAAQAENARGVARQLDLLDGFLASVEIAYV